MKRISFFPFLPLLVASIQLFLLPSARSTSKAPHRTRERRGCESVCSSRALPLVVRSRSAFEAAREHRSGVLSMESPRKATLRPLSARATLLGDMYKTLESQEEGNI